MVQDLLLIIWIVAKILLLVICLLVAVAYLTLAERKVIGYIQSRIGPNRQGIRGVTQPIADVIKLMTSLGVYGVLVSGWASNSKYALFGALRAAAQTVSYEIAMGFALVGVLLAAGSMNLQDIVMRQQGSLLHLRYFSWRNMLI